MKYMKQFAIILAVSCVGELLNYFLPLPFPASIYGLVIMLILLITHRIKLPDVDETATFLVEVMPMMFIPAGVGLLTAWSDLKPIIVPILVITIVSTFLVMGVTGKVTDALVQGTNTGEEKELEDEISQDERKIFSLQEDVTRKEAAKTLVMEEESEKPSRLGEEFAEIRKGKGCPFKSQGRKKAEGAQKYKDGTHGADIQKGVESVKEEQR
ncbi:MAG: CidA/LrgA family protein [Bilifractor sp.]